MDLRDICYIAVGYPSGSVRYAVLDDLGPDAAFQNPHMFEIIAGLEQTLRARGYRLILRGVDGAGAYEVAEDIISRKSADGYAMTDRLLDEKQLPDAIVCANNYIALGCVAAIQERGMGIPEDVGVLTFDDYPFSRFTEPQLTVVDIDVRDLGIRAGKHLVEIIRHPTLQVQTNVTASIIIERRSTRRRTST